jgi:hypothetical protein
LQRERFERAIAAMDAANGDDPVEIEVRGEKRSKERAHAELASEWVRELAGDPGEALLLAARAHHLRRWSIPRANHPDGRRGYLAWRRELMDFHAQLAGEILGECGYDEETVARVRHIILRRDRSRGDEGSQILEDALCLVFFETQLTELAGRLAPDKIRDVGLKTLRKMSSRGHELTLGLPLDPDHLALLRELIAEL